VAFKVIEEDSGSHFDPTVVSAFLSARSDVEALIIHWNEAGAKRISERAY
jgi:HD-GYP domain-containing protein (c-di-GMP phosphodiesterase class II)